MTVMLCLEHKFYFDDKRNELFSQKVINDDILLRYTSVFEKVAICARQLEHKPENAIKIMNRDVMLIGLPNYSFPDLIINRRMIQKTIFDNSKNIDGYIIRSPSTISYLAYTIAKKSKKPIMTELVINPANFFYSDKNDSFLRKVLNVFCRRYAIFHTKSLCKHSNAVLYVTKENLQNVFKSYDMINGEDSSHFSVACSDVILPLKNFNNDYPIHKKDDNFTICHIGWMNGLNKGHMVVMDILKKLLINGYKCDVVFIGDGVKKECFIQYAEKLNITGNVKFLGQLNSFEAIQTVFKTSHLFLFPSVNEGLPRVLLEAMANSVPCVAYRTDGIPELIDAEWLADIGDTDRLYNIVVKLYCNEILRRKVIIENYNKAKWYEDTKLAPIRFQFYKNFKALL